MQEELEYRGETKPRRKSVAIFVTLLCPGLGYLYVGRLKKGLVVNVLFLLLLEAFVIIFSFMKFFPLLPALVVAMGWLTFAAFAASDVASKIEPGQKDTDEYVLQTYNHWMIYSVVALLTFAAPIAVTLSYINNNLLGYQTIASAGMFPTLKPGDAVFYDKSAYDGRAPARGELVLVRTPGTDNLATLRVVGVADDVVRIEGEQVFVNDQPLERGPLPGGPLTQGDLLAMVENNNGSKYVISVSPKAYVATSMPPTKLENDEFFVLADNRSQVPLDPDHERIRDSRIFEAISRDDIIGKPLYIAWSSAEDEGVRFDRIGLRIR